MQVADHLRSTRIRGELPLRAVGGGPVNGGRGTTQEEDKDSGLGQARCGNVRSGSPAGESSSRKSGKGAEQGDRFGKRQGKGRKGTHGTRPRSPVNQMRRM